MTTQAEATYQPQEIEAAAQQFWDQAQSFQVTEESGSPSPAVLGG